MMIYARTTLTPNGVLVAIAIVPADLFPQQELLIRIFFLLFIFSLCERKNEQRRNGIRPRCAQPRQRRRSV